MYWSSGFAGEVAIPALFSNQIRTSGIMVGSRTDREDMIRAIAANRLRPIIDRQYPLRNIVGAFEYFESRRHFGKVCIELWQRAVVGVDLSCAKHRLDVVAVRIENECRIVAWRIAA